MEDVSDGIGLHSLESVRLESLRRRCVSSLLDFVGFRENLVECPKDLVMNELFVDLTGWCAINAQLARLVASMVAGDHEAVLTDAPLLRIFGSKVCSLLVYDQVACRLRRHS